MLWAKQSMTIPHQGLSLKCHRHQTSLKARKKRTWNNILVIIWSQRIKRLFSATLHQNRYNISMKKRYPNVFSSYYHAKYEECILTIQTKLGCGINNIFHVILKGNLLPWTDVMIHIVAALITINLHLLEQNSEIIFFCLKEQSVLPPGKIHEREVQDAQINQSPHKFTTQ